MPEKYRMLVGALLTAGWVSILFYGSTWWDMLLG